MKAPQKYEKPSDVFRIRFGRVALAYRNKAKRRGPATIGQKTNSGNGSLSILDPWRPSGCWHPSYLTD